MGTSIVDELLKNMTNMLELGRQRAFELGNPFYAKFDEDGGYYREEMPDGEKFLVTVKVILTKMICRLALKTPSLES